MAEPFEVQPLPPLFQTPRLAPAEPEGSAVADLALSWEMGWEQMKGVPAWMQGFGAALLEKAGFEDAARGQRIAARNLATEMYNNIGDLEALYSGPHSWKEAQEVGTIGSYAMWGINETIKQVPNLAVMALGALLSGGAFTPALLGRFAIARGMSALPFAAGNAVRGAQIAGVGLSSALLNTGEIYSSALLESGENNPIITGLAGLIAGSVDMWPGSKVIRAMGKGSDLGSAIANAFLRNKKWRSRFYRSLELGVTEGIVEDLQTVIEAFTINYLNSNDLSREYVDKAYGFIPITAEQVNQRMEARAAGGLLGGLLGFPGRTSTRMRGRGQQVITHADMQQMDDALATVTVAYGAEDQFVPVGEYFDRRGEQPTTFQQRIDVRRPTVVGGPSPLAVEGAPQLGGTTAEAISGGGMDPFATIPAERQRVRVTGLDLPPVTTRRLAQWSNKTTQEASTILGTAGKPETKAQRRARVAKEKKAKKREDARLEIVRGRAEATAALEAGLAANLAGEIPAARAGVPIAPTVTVTYGEEFAGEVAAISEDAKKSPYTIVDYGRGPGTVEFDVDRGMLIAMMLDDVRLSKVAAEQEQLRDLQKALLMEKYLALGPKPKDESITTRKEKLLGILKGLGLDEKDISLSELGPKLSATSSLPRLEEAIKNFIGKDLLYTEDMEGAYSEDEIRQIINSRQTLAAIDRAEAGDPRALRLFERYGIPLSEEKASARASLEAARAESIRRFERSEAAGEEARLARWFIRKELGPKKGKKAAPPVVTKAMEDREELGLPQRIIRRKKKEPPLFTVRARAIPSEKKAKRPIIQVAGPEPVTITMQDVIDKVEKELPPVPPLSSDADVATYLETEDAYTLVWNSFVLSDKGDNIDISKGTRLGPEGVRGSVMKIIEKLYPEGKELYDLEYYESQVFDPESRMGKLLGDKSIANIKAEIKARTGKEPVAVSPAGTYVVREKPTRKKILMFERDEKGDVKLYNAEEVFQLDEKGNVVLHDEGGVEVGAYDPSSTMVRGEGQPKVTLTEPTKEQRAQMPERLMLYDKNDQLLLEQFIDDERNFKLVARLNNLKTKYGLVKDIPMYELANVARDFSIGSRFVGAVARRGKVRMMVLETAEMKQEDVAGAIWFRVPENESMSQYLALTDLGNRYQDLIKIEGMTPDRSWNMALMQQIDNMQKMANIRYDQVVASNEILLENIENTAGNLTQEEVKAAKKELDSILKNEEAVFDLDAITKITAFANQNRAFIVDPENLEHAPPVPKGKEVGAQQVYNSLRNSASQGKRSFYVGTGIDETQDSFMARASVPPRAPREVTPGSKVSLTAAAWAPVYKKDPFIQAIGKDILRIKGLLGERGKRTQQRFIKRTLVPLGEEPRWDEGDVVVRFQLVETSARKMEAAVNHVVAREMEKSEPRSPVLWSDEEVGLIVEGMGRDLMYKNLKGEWVAPWQITPQQWREHFERSYWEARQDYYENLSPKQLKSVAERKRESITKLFKDRAKAKPIISKVQKKPDNWKDMDEGERATWMEGATKVVILEEESMLADSLAELQMVLSAAIGDIISQEYNVVKVKGDTYTLQRVGEVTIEGRGAKFDVPAKHMMVVSFSQQGLNRYQANEVHALQTKADAVAKRGTRDLPSKLEKLRRAKTVVQNQLNKKLDAVTTQENKEAITPAAAEIERQKIQGQFTWRVFEELREETHGGQPFISLPKEIRDRVRAKEITYKEGLREYINSIKARFAETRLVRVSRLRRERLEDEDRLLIAALQKMDGKWYLKKEFTPALLERIKKVGQSLRVGPKIVGVNIPEVYKALQVRYDELSASREARLDIRPETFEGRRQPTPWREGRYWEFVKSSDEVTLPAKPRYANRWVKAVPRQRWKNAYGVIIDKLTITYRPGDATEDTVRDIYEVIDPFVPENSRTFVTLEGAKAAFGSAKYYRKLGEVPAAFPPVRTPSPQDIGRDVTFPKRNLNVNTKGRPTRQVTTDAPLTTDQVMEDVAKGQKVVVTVLSEDSNKHKIVVTKTYEDVIPYTTGEPKTRIHKPTEKRIAEKTPPSLRVVGQQIIEEGPAVTPEFFEAGAGRPTRIVKRGQELKKLKGKPGGLYSLVLVGEYTDGGMPHTLTAEEDEGGSSLADVEGRLNEAFGVQVFNFVHVVQSMEDLPLDYQMNRINYDTKMRAVTYNTEIYMVADNIPMDRVVPVAIHEIGAHGMQAVMGKRFYQKLMAQVAAMVENDSEIRAIYERVKEETDTQNEAILLEEVMAYIVENEAMSDSTFWRAVVDSILYGLARLKLWLNPKWIGSAEILIFAKAAARRHVNLAKDKDSVFEANFLGTFLYSGDLGHKASASDYKDKLVGSLREQVGPEIVRGFEGEWFTEDVPLPKTWWENFLIVRDVSLLPAVLGKRVRKIGGRRYQIYVAPSVTKWIADYFIILRHLEDSIRERGGVVTAKNMPSLFHGAYKNIVNTKRKLFHAAMVIPLQKFMKDKGISGDDLHWYLYARHAPSRNRVKAGQAKARGLPNASGLFTTEAEAIAYNEINNTSLQSAEGVLKRLENTLGKEKFRDLEKASEYIYRINNLKLQQQLETGMLNLKRLNERQLNAYHDKEYQATYVPLMGDNIVVADEFFEQKLGPGKIGVSGPESKKVHGRVSEAENTWAWSVMEMDYEIDRIEKNRVILSFAQLIRDNEENLKDFATVVELADYKNHRDPFTKKLLLGLHEKQQTDPDHNIHFKADGMEFVILVKDKRIGQAFNRTNMTDSGVFLQTTSMINRWFSAVHTSINPEFVITNFVRDFQTAMFNLQGVKETTAEFKDADALGRKVFKDIKSAGVGLKQFIRDGRTDTEWSALAEEFSLEGGRIDFFAFKDVRDFEKKLKDYIKDTSASGAKRWAKEMIGFIGDYNAVVENTMRLATYKNAKEAFIANGMDMGDSKRRAADIARNLTVNFSQKGEKGAALNSLYLFFNASVQGTVRLFQALFRRPMDKKGFTRVQKIAGGIMLYSFTQAILNSMLGGDDEDGVNRYRQIDLQSRGRTAHIYLPGFDTFFKIPLPYGYNIFHAIGDTLAALMMGHVNPGRATMHVMASAAESFMPFSFGSSDDLFVAGLKAATPTFGDPLVDLALNESYFGQPIYKDPVWGSSDPPSERYWSSTGGIFKGVSRALNALTLGSRVEPGFVSIPPDIFEFLWESIGGGAARFVERSTDLVWMIGPGRLTHRETGEVKWNKVPFARRFFYDETATRNRFVYDKFSEYEKAIKAATGLNTGILEVYGREKGYENFKESEDYQLFKLDDYLRKIAGALTKLQKDRTQIVNNRILRNDLKQDRIDKLNDRMRDLRVRLINKVDEIWE